LAVSRQFNASLYAGTLNLIQVKKELCNRIAAVMSALGQKRTFSEVCVMSALPRRTLVERVEMFVPKADSDHRFPLTEGRVLGRDDEVAAHHQLEGAGPSHPVDGCEDGLAQLAHEVLRDVE
jgi:hypothetical protein